jgi:hypothetical protein
MSDDGFGGGGGGDDYDYDGPRYVFDYNVIHKELLTYHSSFNDGAFVRTWRIIL